MWRWCGCCRSGAREIRRSWMRSECASTSCTSPVSGPLQLGSDAGVRPPHGGFRRADATGDVPAGGRPDGRRLTGRSPAMTALAEAVRRHWPSYAAAHGPRIPVVHRRAAQAILRCRTPEAGLVFYRCETAFGYLARYIQKTAHDLPALRPRTRTATASQMNLITSPIHHVAQAGPPIFQSATNGHATAMPASGQKPPLPPAPGHTSPEILPQHVTKRPPSARTASSLLAPAPKVSSSASPRPKSFPLAAQCLPPQS